MDLIVDIGNTRIKWAFFENDAVVAEGVVEKEFFTAEISAHKAFDKVSRIGVCTVNEVPESISRLFTTAKALFYVNAKAVLTFTSNYQSMTTLGADRLALVAAAQQEYPTQNCLVIDLGTCITYDLKDSDGVYHGGIISPGCMSRYNAMHKDTHGLPLLDAKSLDKHLRLHPDAYILLWFDRSSYPKTHLTYQGV